MEHRGSSWMASRIDQCRFKRLSMSMMLVFLVTVSAAAQTAREVRGAAAVEPLQSEPPAKLVIDPPLAGPLSHGRVVIQYRTENLHLAPVFGPAALAVSPRVGHIHVSLDDASWVWVDASGEPVIMNGLPSGPHKVLIQLESANHQLLDQGSVEFTIPEHPGPASAHAQNESALPVAATVVTSQCQPPAKLIVDAPKAEPLSRGVLFLPYHAENLQILPVFGPAALGVTPRIGHIHMTVDDAAWHWADASGVPVIINGLAPGPHKVLIQLVNANHRPLAQQVVTFTVPGGSPALDHN
jgi:hypothetical protein